MRKTRLVILPTKCLHQMGFLLLFLSCPVIGDWGRIRPESETLHKAIKADREGTCGLQRDPPGGLLDVVNESGSDQCRLSEDFHSDMITKKHQEITSTERRDSLQRSILRRDSERRQSDNRRGVQRANERITNNRRDFRRSSQRRLSEERRDAGERDIRREVRENSRVRSRSVEMRRSPSRRSENEEAVRRQRQVTRTVHNDNEIETRIKREALRRVARSQSDRRESERRLRTTKERQSQSVVRLTNREREDTRRSLRESSPRRKENDMAVRQTRERSQDRQTERLSLARREIRNTRNSENRRNTERRDTQIRKTRSLKDLGDAIEQRRTESRSFDARQDMENRRSALSAKQTQRDFRERRVVFLSDRIDTNLKPKTGRVISAPNYKNPLEDMNLENKSEDDEIPVGVTKWLDFKKFDSVKVGDWTTNCVIGAVVYFLSTRQIKAA